MPNKEYIERNALKRDLIDNRSFYPAIVKNAIETAPTVDAVEVVRCKDCMFWKPYDGRIEAMVCHATFDHHGRERLTTPDDFCSCGKRRKE